MYPFQKKSFLVIVYLTLSIDVLAGISVHFHALQILNILQMLLYPIACLFELIRIPISGTYFNGAQPLIYYRVLLLSSALAGTGWSLIHAWTFCRRFRFFRYPAYHDLALQRAYLRHRDIFRHSKWYYFIYVRILSLALISLSITIIFIMYPGRITFHVHDLVMPVIFSLLPGLCWSLLSISVLNLTSCACSDLLAIKRALTH
jgi:hypothetical protein